MIDDRCGMRGNPIGSVETCTYVRVCVCMYACRIMRTGRKKSQYHTSSLMFTYYVPQQIYKRLRVILICWLSS